MTTVEQVGLREQKRHALRRAVRAAAWELIIQRGYDAITVDDIAREAGVSTATFYRHFTGKEAVVTRRWLSPERFATIEPEIDREHGIPAVVASLFDAYGRTVETYHVDLLTRLRVIHLDPGLQLAMAKGRAEDVGTLADLFAKTTGKDSGSLAMRLAASLTIDARVTTMSWWAELGGKPSLRQMLARTAETLAPTLVLCESGDADLSR